MKNLNNTQDNNEAEPVTQEAPLKKPEHSKECIKLMTVNQMLGLCFKSAGFDLPPSYFDTDLERLK